MTRPPRRPPTRARTRAAILPELPHPSPDAAGVPAQMWRGDPGADTCGRGSRHRCGRVDSGRGANVGGAEPSPGADVERGRSDGHATGEWGTPWARRCSFVRMRVLCARATERAVDLRRAALRAAHPRSAPTAARRRRAIRARAAQSASTCTRVRARVRAPVLVLAMGSAAHRQAAGLKPRGGEMAQRLGINDNLRFRD
jgi:hypothetical protein